MEHQKDFACHCHYGYIGDGYQCTLAPTFQGDYILFTQGMSILRMPLDSDGAQQQSAGYPLITRSGQTPVGLDVDCLTGHVYWSDVVKGNIYKAPYNGSGSELILEVFPKNSTEGIAIEWVSRNIYWTDSMRRTIEVANLEGNMHKTLIDDGLVNPRGIAVHPSL